MTGNYYFSSLCMCALSLQHGTVPLKLSLNFAKHFHKKYDFQRFFIDSEFRES